MRYPTEHRHMTEEKYIPEVLVKQGVKRWILVDACTGCTYQRARSVVYEQPPANQLIMTEKGTSHEQTKNPQTKN